MRVVRGSTPKLSLRGACEVPPSGWSWGGSQIDGASLCHPLSSLLQHLQEGVAADAGSDPTHPLLSLFLRRCLGGDKEEEEGEGRKGERKEDG